jgi:NADH:ubiquinone oxidoreductase subunit E
MTWIAQKLGLEPINILELVTFYPMYRQKPAGKKHIRICRTLSCAMAGRIRAEGSSSRRLPAWSLTTITTTDAQSRSRR